MPVVQLKPTLKHPWPSQDLDLLLETEAVAPSTGLREDMHFNSAALRQNWQKLYFHKNDTNIYDL